MPLPTSSCKSRRNARIDVTPLKGKAADPSSAFLSKSLYGRGSFLFRLFDMANRAYRHVQNMKKSTSLRTETDRIAAEGSFLSSERWYSDPSRRRGILADCPGRDRSEQVYPTSSANKAKLFETDKQGLSSSSRKSEIMRAVSTGNTDREEEKKTEISHHDARRNLSIRTAEDMQGKGRLVDRVVWTRSSMRSSDGANAWRGRSTVATVDTATPRHRWYRWSRDRSRARASRYSSLVLLCQEQGRWDTDSDECMFGVARPFFTTARGTSAHLCCIRLASIMTSRPNRTAAMTRSNGPVFATTDSIWPLGSLPMPSSTSQASDAAAIKPDRANATQRKPQKGGKAVKASASTQPIDALTAQQSSSTPKADSIKQSITADAALDPSSKPAKGKHPRKKKAAATNVAGAQPTSPTIQATSSVAATSASIPRVKLPVPKQPIPPPELVESMSSSGPVPLVPASIPLPRVSLPKYSNAGLPPKPVSKPIPPLQPSGSRTIMTSAASSGLPNANQLKESKPKKNDFLQVAGSSKVSKRHATNSSSGGEAAGNASKPQRVKKTAEQRAAERQERQQAREAFDRTSSTGSIERSEQMLNLMSSAGRDLSKQILALIEVPSLFPHRSSNG